MCFLQEGSAGKGTESHHGGEPVWGSSWSGERESDVSTATWVVTWVAWVANIVVGRGGRGSGAGAGSWIDDCRTLCCDVAAERKDGDERCETELHFGGVGFLSFRLKIDKTMKLDTRGLLKSLRVRRRAMCR